MERGSKTVGLPAWARLVLEESTAAGHLEDLPPSKSVTGMWLERLVLKRLLELPASPKSGIVRFPDVFEKLCRNFSITKKECWELLLILRDSGLIEVVPNQGVQVLPSAGQRSLLQQSAQLRQ